MQKSTIDSSRLFVNKKDLSLATLILIKLKTYSDRGGSLPVDVHTGISFLARQISEI